MNRLIATSLATVAVLAVLVSAQEPKGGTARTAQPAPAQTVQTFDGTSADGNVQQALNDALTKAQQALAKNATDVQFKWQLDTVTGTRGGITGSMACNVRIRILP